jgi:hypothetical protein
MNTKSGRLWSLLLAALMAGTGAAAPASAAVQSRHVNARQVEQDRSGDHGGQDRERSGDERGDRGQDRNEGRDRGHEPANAQGRGYAPAQGDRGETHTWEAGRAPQRTGNRRVTYRPIGTRLRALPPGYDVISFGGTFYYCAGQFYRTLEPDEYAVVPAPMGAEVPYLPLGYQTLTYGGEEIYYFDGVYYRYDPGRDMYLIISPPPGLEVSYLPSDYQTVIVHSQPYVVYQGVRYRPIERNGVRFFVVVRF